MKGIKFILRKPMTKENLEKFRADEERRKDNMNKRIANMREEYLAGKFDNIIREL